MCSSRKRVQSTPRLQQHEVEREFHCFVFLFLPLFYWFVFEFAMSLSRELSERCQSGSRLAVLNWRHHLPFSRHRSGSRACQRRQISAVFLRWIVGQSLKWRVREPPRLNCPQQQQRQHELKPVPRSRSLLRCKSLPSSDFRRWLTAGTITTFASEISITVPEGQHSRGNPRVLTPCDGFVLEAPSALQGPQSNLASAFLHSSTQSIFWSFIVATLSLCMLDYVTSTILCLMFLM